jgi:hypothetical protein
MRRARLVTALASLCWDAIAMPVIAMMSCVSQRFCVFHDPEITKV